MSSKKKKSRLSLQSEVERAPEQKKLKKQNTSKLISTFHTKLKEREAAAPSKISKQVVEKDLEELGGLEEYQRISRSGEEIQGDSSDWVIEELNKRRSNSTLTLLDVGAIVHRYKRKDDRLRSDIKLKVIID